uniref:p13 protein n=1 Tax=Piscine orthoreovirus TaxID=1157337 RepID=A0A4P8GKR9_9REOV|nr:p13 protein [Piscine orthoreovirus]
MMTNITFQASGSLAPQDLLGSVPLEYVLNAGIGLVCLIMLSLLWSLINAMARRCGIILHPMIGHGVNGAISSLAARMPFLQTPTPTSECSTNSGLKTTVVVPMTDQTDGGSLKLSNALETTCEV